MAEPGDPTRFIPWLLMALGAVGTTLWAAVKSSRKAENDAKKELADAIAKEKDKRIAVLEADNARLAAIVEKLGGEKDQLRNQLEMERLRAAGVVYRVHQDSQIDDALVDDMP